MIKDTQQGQTHYAGDGCQPPHPPVEQFDFSEVEREFDIWDTFDEMRTHEEIKMFIRQHCVPKKDYNLSVQEIEILKDDLKREEEYSKDLKSKLNAVRKWCDEREMLIGKMGMIDELRQILTGEK